MSDWISISDQFFPLSGEFLGFDGDEIYVVERCERYGKPGWYIVKTNCCCCNSYCSIILTHWMPLPNPPNKLIRQTFDKDLLKPFN